MSDPEQAEPAGDNLSDARRSQQCVQRHRVQFELDTSSGGIGGIGGSGSEERTTSSGSELRFRRAHEADTFEAHQHTAAANRIVDLAGGKVTTFMDRREDLPELLVQELRLECFPLFCF